MRTAIGEYDSYRQAQHAVRGLESEVSIQDIVIAGKGGLGGTALHATGELKYTVFMSGPAEDVQRARAMLQRTRPAV